MKTEDNTTAPESSPLGAGKQAEAIAREYAMQLISQLGESREPLFHLINGIILEAAAAIQRGDGQADVLKALEVAHDGLEAAKEIASDSRVQDSYWDGVRDCIKVSDAVVCKTIASIREANQPVRTTPPAAKPDETSGATPRTDAIRDNFRGGDIHAFGRALIAHANTLERELNAVRAAGAEGKAMSDLTGMTKLELVARCFNLQLKLDRDAAKSTLGESGLSALDFTRLRDWFADPRRKPAMFAFTAGPARDAAAAFETSAKKQLAEREAELASVKHLAAAEKQRIDDVLDQEQEALAKCRAKLAEQSAALVGAKDALLSAKPLLDGDYPTRTKGTCKLVDAALAQIEALAGGSTSSASLPSS